MRYPVLIFDLDDTLIESFPAYAATHQRVAEDLGWRVPTLDELVHYGPTWEHTLARLWPELALEPFFERYDQLAEAHPYPALPGVNELLAGLRERGHSLWIVTKRSRARLAQRIRQAELAHELFDGIFAVEDQPAAKPDPRCFEPVWQQLGHVAHDRAVYVGDREDDLLAARGAGLQFVGVRTGPEHRARQTSFLDALPREHVLDSVIELATWLEAQR
jgi:phosphoglycolate phosphatase